MLFAFPDKYFLFIEEVVSHGALQSLCLGPLQDVESLMEKHSVLEKGFLKEKEQDAMSFQARYRELQVSHPKHDRRRPVRSVAPACGQTGKVVFGWYELL